MSFSKTNSGNAVKLNLKSGINNTSNAWTNLVNTSSNEIIDEDALLAGDNIGLNSIQANNLDDCGVGGKTQRKACKGCTCGRAEQENNAVGIDDIQQAPSGGCGSCGLGDAFRCSTCPYLGQPAFDMNNKGGC